MKNKDRSIAKLVDALRLPERSWVVNDNWDADLFAIGIASKAEPRRLVYISTWNMPPGRYYYECETPNGPDVVDYEVTDEAKDVDLHTLVRAMVKHLST